MTVLVPIAMFGWIPAVFVLFAALPPRRAVIGSFLAAWMFLPVAGYQIEGLPDYTKMSATCAGVLLATAVFDPRRLGTFRPRWFDAPMAVWCAVPLASSISNGLGLYDGLATALTHTIMWGLPYFLGRIYLTDLAGLRELAIGIFIGGLIYVPLCLYEIRMSPQLHTMVYGYHQHSFIQTMRFGGWRPVVFMQHGLMVGMWMASASIVGLCLWRSRAIVRLWSIPSGFLVSAVAMTTLLCKSLNGIVLLFLGTVAVVITKWVRSALPMAVLVLAAPAYMCLRAADLWSGQGAVALVAGVNEQRAASLRARMHQEDLFSDKAWQRPIFGWGGWGRMFPTDEQGARRTRGIDSLWIIAPGNERVGGTG